MTDLDIRRIIYILLFGSLVFVVILTGVLTVLAVRSGEKPGFMYGKEHSCL